MKINYFFLFLIFSFKLEGIRYPTNPKSPTLSPVQKSINKNSPQKKKQISRKVKLTLATGDQIIGNATFPEIVQFQHFYKQIKYHKKIKNLDIKNILIKRYTSFLVSSKGNFTQYDFRPSEVILKTVHGNKYKLPYLFKDMHEIHIETFLGKTKLYSFFRDTWNKFSGWTEVDSTDPKYHQTKAHPRSIVEIEFFPTTETNN